jgi:hypothetical protein
MAQKCAAHLVRIAETSLARHYVEVVEHMPRHFPAPAYRTDTGRLRRQDATGQTVACVYVSPDEG